MNKKTYQGARDVSRAPFCGYASLPLDPFLLFILWWPFVVVVVGGGGGHVHGVSLPQDID